MFGPFVCQNDGFVGTIYLGSQLHVVVTRSVKRFQINYLYILLTKVKSKRKKL